RVIFAVIALLQAGLLLGGDLQKGGGEEAGREEVPGGREGEDGRQQAESAGHQPAPPQRFQQRRGIGGCGERRGSVRGSGNRDEAACLRTRGVRRFNPRRGGQGTLG